MKKHLNLKPLNHKKNNNIDLKGQNYFSIITRFDTNWYIWSYYYYYFYYCCLMIDEKTSMTLHKSMALLDELKMHIDS